MAPHKATNKTKKTKVSATSKAKPAAKKKEKVPINPMEKLDKQVASIAILGERRDNALRISKGSHDFSLATILPKILKEHPNCHVWISGGSPQAPLQQGGSCIPILLLHLVPDGKSPPPFVAYSVKDDLKIQDLSKQKLAWSNVAPRVSILKSTRRMTQRSIGALTDDSMAMEEHIQLWTLIPREKLQLNKKGKIDVRFANFTIPSSKEGAGPIYGTYEKGDGLQECIEMFVDEYGTEIGDDAEAKVKNAITEAFAEARSKLEEQKDLLEKTGYDEKLLDSIQTIKLYPKGTDEFVKSSYINAYYNRAEKVMIA